MTRPSKRKLQSRTAAAWSKKARFQSTESRDAEPPTFAELPTFAEPAIPELQDSEVPHSSYQVTATVMPGVMVLKDRTMQSEIGPCTSEWESRGDKRMLGNRKTEGRLKTCMVKMQKLLKERRERERTYVHKPIHSQPTPTTTPRPPATHNLKPSTAKANLQLPT